MLRSLTICALAGLALAAAAPARAQPPAKALFGAERYPADLATRSFGSYTRGCLAGGEMLPVNGPAWQAMRLSRNRFWGHPVLVRYVERLAIDARTRDGWPGLLVGDMAQPRGGPMDGGHASHQIGLDADIWLMPMPDRRMTAQEREDVSAVSVLAPDQLSIDETIWTDAHMRLLRRAASYPEVARIFVHPAIKKKLCETAGENRAWLSRIRPWWSHHYHFHVRLNCPRGNPDCVEQPAPPPGEGCGQQLEDWYAMLRRAMKPRKEPEMPRVRPDITMAQMPAQCRAVIEAKDRPPVMAAAAGEPGLPWLQGVTRLQSSPAEGVPWPDRKPRRVASPGGAER